jgi:predicted phosphodiesterase
MSRFPHCAFYAIIQPMRVLILSDIHANLTALEAVLADAGKIDAAWCLGDLVGYGPDPNECIARVWSLPDLVCILGNHDAAVIGQLDDSSFNPEARQAILWTREVLWEGSALFLKGLPEKAELDGVTLAHGSPRQPVWEYLLDSSSATRSFEYFEKPYCFVGHTHLPVIYQLSEENSSARLETLEPNTCRYLSPRAILNPGSVGQPRPGCAPMRSTTQNRSPGNSAVFGIMSLRYKAGWKLLIFRAGTSSAWQWAGRRLLQKQEYLWVRRPLRGLRNHKKTLSQERFQAILRLKDGINWVLK